MTSTEKAGLSRRALLTSTAVAGAAAAATTIMPPGVALAAPPAPALAGLQAPILRMGSTIPTPEDYFGTRIGSDGYLAQWKDMVPYFQLIGENSTRVDYQEIGKTTLG